ncbi:MAG: hypothetical protein DMG13_19460 [Acidobacteria bacterium]|nr:MAG: hypothetical protein DMG13_19460 [Acidobacteriota bacterium]
MDKSHKSHSNSETQIGIIVDAGPTVGYSRVVRCLRLANALARHAAITFYPLSEPCREFLTTGETEPKFEIRNSNFESHSLPALVITDLHEAHGITATIHRHHSRHISIHDLGLAQCRSDVAIDGGITRLFPYAADKNRALYTGPQYMITREPVTRATPTDTVLIAIGGGSRWDYTQKISTEMDRIGLRPIMTGGFAGSVTISEEELAHAMSTCRFAISGAGPVLYDLVASAVPTIAVAFDRIQLRTADAFHERGAVLSAGLAERAFAPILLSHCLEMLENAALVQRITEVGQRLVDGNGLSRVVEIVRRESWLTGNKTCTA